MRFYHCPDCGAALELRPVGDEGDTPWCPTCQKPLFDLFATCIIALVVNRAGQAAILRQGYISQQYGNLVSGYMQPGENAEEATRREIEEELGLSVTGLEYAGTWWLDKKEMLMIGFFARAEGVLRLSGEVDSARWTPLSQALEQVHPAGSVSHAMVETYLKLYGEESFL